MIAQRDDVAPALPLDTILCGDALDMLRGMPDASVDAIVTDPPYGLGAAPDMLDVLRAWMAGESYQPRGRGGFMGKAWDAFVPGPEYWRECLRVLKPGGHALVFAGTRTWDVMGLALRLAGFELRDTCQWLYGSGFPKSLDVSKQLDKVAGAKREVKGRAPDWKVSRKWREREGRSDLPTSILDITAPATDAARAWDGWGTALKPAWEPIIVCRKPLAEPTVAANVLTYGTGALNIAASRVRSAVAPKAWATPRGGIWRTDSDAKAAMIDNPTGRWPANLLLSHAEDCVEGGPCSLWCPVRELDAQSGVSRSISGLHGGATLSTVNTYRKYAQRLTVGYTDSGGASRYFSTFRYVAKASRAERNRGCETMAARAVYGTSGAALDGISHSTPAQNHHPTVKPLALMSWLIGLITPPGGLVLDPFAGSGSTLVAAKAGGWRYVGIEREAEYVVIAEARLEATP